MQQTDKKNKSKLISISSDIVRGDTHFYSKSKEKLILSSRLIPCCLLFVVITVRAIK